MISEIRIVFPVKYLFHCHPGVVENVQKCSQKCLQKTKHDTAKATVTFMVLSSAELTMTDT